MSEIDTHKRIGRLEDSFADMLKQFAKMETSIAVLAKSAELRDTQLKAISDALTKHIDKEELILAGIATTLSKTRQTCDDKHDAVAITIAKVEGVMLGGKILAVLLSGLSGVALFMGFKGLK